MNPGEGGGGRAAAPAGPEQLAEFVLDVGGGRIVATVLRRADGSVVTRLGRGDVAGYVLTSEHVAALRVTLRHCLEVMCPLERRAA